LNHIHTALAPLFLYLMKFVIECESEYQERVECVEAPDAGAALAQFRSHPSHRYVFSGSESVEELSEWFDRRAKELTDR
jgi:hypothetical protein